MVAGIPITIRHFLFFASLICTDKAGFQVTLLGVESDSVFFNSIRYSGNVITAKQKLYNLKKIKGQQIG
jgi:hypothetical protein